MAPYHLFHGTPFHTMKKHAADSSAALAMFKRKAARQLLHTSVSALWIQDVQGREVAEYMNIFGRENPADLMTKSFARDKMNKALKSTG